MLKEQKALLEKIRESEQDALKLYNAGVKLSNTVLKLRAAGDELATRIRYIEKDQAAPQVAPPQNVRELLLAKNKTQLLELVLEHNTTPGNSELVLPENPTKAQLVEALLTVAK